MKHPQIQFKVTTIALKKRFNDSDTEIGSCTGDVYDTLLYLERCGLNFTRQRLYKVKGGEYCVKPNNVHAIKCDPEFEGRREYCRRHSVYMHLRIERI